MAMMFARLAIHTPAKAVAESVGVNQLRGCVMSVGAIVCRVAASSGRMWFYLLTIISFGCVVILAMV
jgi:hypothetical protein